MRGKQLFIAGAVLGFIGVGLAIYMYNKPHKNYENMKPDVTIFSQDLIDAFEQNEKKANEMYLNKVLLVSGSVVDLAPTDYGDYSVTLTDLMFGVTCHFSADQVLKQSDLLKSLKLGDEVKIKGRCDGFLTDVRLTQCSVQH